MLVLVQGLRVVQRGRHPGIAQALPERVAVIHIEEEPTGSGDCNSPRLALFRIPPCKRALMMCNSASLIVPLSPSNSWSLKSEGS